MTKNTSEIFKHYVMLKLTEKSYKKRLRILSQHHGIDEDVIAKILQHEEAREAVKIDEYIKNTKFEGFNL